MPTTIDQLDDLSLLRIFDELSICDLFRAGRVCVWWNAIRSKSANGRKELTLMVGHGAQRFIDEALFHVPERLMDENGDALIPLKSDAPFQVESLSVNLGKFLCLNLLHLTILTISCDKTDHLDLITSLLEQFASTGQLHTLKLFTEYPHQPLLSTLNSIATLKKLQLNLSQQQFTYSNRYYNLEKLDLPILGQLEEFDFYASQFGNECLKNSIVRYAVQNRELRNIRIHFCTNFDWLLSLPREFASRFTHLHTNLNGPFPGLNGFMENALVDRLEEMCRHFHKLTSLELTQYFENPPTPTQLFTSLSHLHNLLSLTIDTHIMNSIPSVVEAVSKNIPALQSVRILTFKIIKLEHQIFSDRNLHHYFPNVETVRLIRDSPQSDLCVDCRLKCNLKFHEFYSDSIYKLPASFSLMFCTLRLTKILTKCRRLKSVCAKLGDSYLEWSVKEINDFAQNEIDYFSKEIKDFLKSSKNNDDDKDMFDFEMMKNLDSDSVRSEYEVAGTWYRKLDD